MLWLAIKEKFDWSDLHEKVEKKGTVNQVFTVGTHYRIIPTENDVGTHFRTDLSDLLIA